MIDRALIILGLIIATFVIRHDLREMKEIDPKVEKCKALQQFLKD